MFRKSLLSITFMLFVPQLAYSVDLLDGRFQVINEFPMPANLTDPLGDLLFSDDGSQVFIVDASESTGSAVWQAPVTRNAAGDVTGFGTFTQLFADEEIDTGLTLGPGRARLFIARRITALRSDSVMGPSKTASLRITIRLSVGSHLFPPVSQTPETSYRSVTTKVFSICTRHRPMETAVSPLTIHPYSQIFRRRSVNLLSAMWNM